MTLDAPEPIAAYLAAEEAKGRGRVFPAASPKTAVSTTKGGIIAVVTRSANGSKRRTRNTDTFCRWSTRKRTETRLTVRARLTGEFPGSPVELDHIFKLSNNKIASLEIRS